MISIKKARIILGKYGNEMSDEQIQRILVFLYGLSEKIIDIEVENKNIELKEALKSYN